MMKKIWIAIFSLVAATCLLPSCKETLEEVVYSDLTDDNAFTSGENALAAVNAMYSPLHTLYREPMFYFNDVTVDSGFKGGSPFEVMNDQGIYNDNRTLVAWNHLYQIVSRANIVLDKVPEMPQRCFSKISRNRLLGEARFMRAFAYYNLTDIFYQVPLVTDSGIEPTEKPGVTPIDEIERQIEDDLLAAKDLLPKSYAGREDAGRPTYGAATGYLCRLYMREAGRLRCQGKADEAMGYWRDALFEVNDVLALEGSLYSLQPMVWNVFDPSTEEGLYNNELIFAIRASDKTLVNGSWDLGLQFTPWAYDMGWSNILQAIEMSWDFDPADERYSVLQVREFPDVYHPEKTYYMAPATIQETGTIPQNHSVGGVIYEEMIELGETYTQKYKYLYTRQYNYNTPNNLPLLRLSDMLLCKAEILNELDGPTAEAIALVNRVRARAFGNEEHDLRLADYTSREQLRSAICDERLFELNMECLRRPDLIRMGLWKHRMQRRLSRIAEKYHWCEVNEGRDEGYYDGSWASYPDPGELTDNDPRMYMPIPYREVLMNADLDGVRNPGFAGLPDYDGEEPSGGGQTDPPGPGEEEKVTRWEFNDGGGWAWEGQNGTSPSQGWFSDGYLYLKTRKGTQDRSKFRTTTRSYSLGRYTWRAEVPAFAAGDQVSLGAFLYRDDEHELDFEIGYGRDEARSGCGATASQMVACMTSQDHPHISNYIPIDPGWHEFTIELAASGDYYRAVWYIDGVQCQSQRLSYGKDIPFSLHCSLENLSFMGTHLPVQDYTVRFDWVECRTKKNE